MKTLFFFSTKFETTSLAEVAGSTFFWALWMSDGTPTGMQKHCWNCGFAPDVRSAVRAAKSTEGVGGSVRIGLLDRRFAHWVYSCVFTSTPFSGGRVPPAPEDAAYDQLRERQQERDQARLRRVAKKVAECEARIRDAYERACRENERREQEEQARRPAVAKPDARIHWSQILGVPPPWTLEAVKHAFCALANKVHPDKGGTDAEFIRVKAAYDAAKSELGAA